MHMRSASQSQMLNSLIRRGPLTIVLVYSNTCPHCHTYMPLWKKLCDLNKKRSNLVKMEASTYQETPLYEKKPVTGVPTVLFVDKSGHITEADEPRNMEEMARVVRTGSTESRSSETSSASSPMEPATVMERVSASDSMFNVSESDRRTSSNGSRRVPVQSIVSGTTMSENPLPAVPGAPVAVQRGGNPWSAFLMAARQAAPAALLLGAYAATRRSSGLPDARSTRRLRRSNRRSSRRSSH
jgi:thiol-disulfide isomerase/thioredoxin